MADRARIAVFRPSNGNWYVHHKKFTSWGADAKNQKSTQAGSAEDIPVPGVYFNDGQCRHAVFRPSDGCWYFKAAGYNNWGESQGNVKIQCGTAGDIPCPADYFGEGKLRVAVFRPSNGRLYINGSNDKNWGSGGEIQFQCGTAGDIPVPGDYFNEGKARFAVFRPSDGCWYIKGAGFADWGASQNNVKVQCGTRGDIPVPADYFGQNHLRIAVFRPSNGIWYINGTNHLNWGTGGETQVQCGTMGDIPVPADYYKEGRARIAVFRPSNGIWYVNGSNNKNWGSGGEVQMQCGTAGDIPVPDGWRIGTKPKQIKKHLRPMTSTYIKFI